MKFSFINVMKERNNIIEGYWMQDFYGSLEDANKKSQEINAVNGNKLNIAIVKSVQGTNPSLQYFKNLIKI
jgi:hypothetical protein